MFNKLSPVALAITGIISVSAVPVQAKLIQHEYVKNSIIVVYKENTTKSDRLSAQRLVRGFTRDNNADGVDDMFANLLGGKLATLTLSSDSDVFKAIKMISQHPAVKYAEPNYVIKAIGTPDDPDFISLWAMNNTGHGGGTVDADIDAVEAWNITTGDASLIIGVIDTGIDYNHPDLQGNIWINPNEIAGNSIDDDGNGVIDDVHGFSAVNNNGDPMDINGHGTHVSGTIGAKGHNGVGVAGVNWDVSIIGCQFLDAGGSGSTEGAIACIDYLTNLKQNYGVDIKATNNSWGGGGFSQALKDSIESAGDAGILFFAAAGNSASDNDVSPSYPASYDSDAVMAIASTDRNDNMSSFSQWGQRSVDMGAPGSSILSTTPGNSYDTYSGTSMATPHMTGAAALVWSINPDLTRGEMKQLLMDSGDFNADLSGKTVGGTRLNLATALDMADPSPSYRFTVTPASQTIEAGMAASYDFGLGSVAGWDGFVELSVAVSPSLEGVSLSTDIVTAGDSFTADITTSAATPWGDYTITVSGNDGIIEKSKTVSLAVLPQGIADYTYRNDNAKDIPDDNSSGIVSRIEVTDTLQVFGVSADVDITHTWSGDLIVKLTSPQGTETVLHNLAGGSEDDIVKSWELTDFNGEMTAGTWILSVSDNVGADVGTLNHWGMVVSGLGRDVTDAPVAGFDYNLDGLNIRFINTSSDTNNDIVSYDWSFGDGGHSTEMNPTYTYATSGRYTAALIVTDAEGNTDTASMDLDVFEYTIIAEVIWAKVSRSGRALVDLSWGGAMGERVTVYRDGQKVGTTDNDGRYRDRFRNAPASVEYKICETNMSLCSDPIVAQF